MAVPHYINKLDRLCASPDCLTISAHGAKLCSMCLASRETPTIPGRLPVAPGARAIIRRWGSLRAVPAVEKTISRARRGGGLTAFQADLVAGVAGLHPFDIWGPDWSEAI